ncbi:hypothetical protein VP01_677g5 [Puccinia sorghi]|uniref:Uncharacterized protein n=1 Tax=Puccinia sorghi TaxID=27349 RepID=A0A0L6UFF6_9BASI|nr:hypothetical protein VP01_677g5 [Puccinia sorghi]
MVWEEGSTSSSLAKLEPPLITDNTYHQFHTIPIGSDEESDEENLLAVAQATGLTLFDPQNAEESDSETEIDWDEWIFETQPEGAALVEPDEPLERNLNSPWFPFKSKEVTMSCPDQNTLSYACLYLWAIWNSPIGMAYARLDYKFNLRQILAQELANPFVNQHLDFYLEYTGGENIFKMSQCFKWRKYLSPNLRVQMVEENKKNCYIFEPMELKSNNCCAHIYGNQVKSSIAPNLIKKSCLGSLIESCGHKIHDLPLTKSLESQGKSKTYPKIVHQLVLGLDIWQYFQAIQRAHFLSLHFSWTSTKPIQHGLGAGRTSCGSVEWHATDGFKAYNSVLRKNVVVISVVLSFQGHFHAKITNTPISGQALHACRVGNLKAHSLQERKTQDYVSWFLGLNSDGEEVCFVLKSQFEQTNADELFKQIPFTPLSWQLICEKWKLLWQIGKQGNGNQFKNSTAEHGIRDQINRQLIKNLHSPQKAE